MCVCVEHRIGLCIDRPVRSYTYVINKKSNHIYPYFAHGADTWPYPQLAARLY